MTTGHGDGAAPAPSGYAQPMMRSPRLVTIAAAITISASGCAGASAPQTTPGPSPEDPRATLEQVARGERSLWSLVDPSSGLAYAVRREDASGEDPRADAEGFVRTTARICDADDEHLSEITADLATHFGEIGADAPLVCDDLVCAAGGVAEYATTIRLELARAEDGSLALRTVLRVEEISTPVDVAAARWADARAGIATLPPRCP